MKKYIFLLITIANINVYAQGLIANFTYCTFNSPENEPYIETYLSVVGNSVIYKKNETEKFQGVLEITYLFKEGDQIKKFEKINLLSPETIDSIPLNNDFVDQQRISLPNGKYEFEIIIKDLNSDRSPFKTVQNLIIDFPSNSMSISDIELLEAIKKTEKNTIISKNGYDLIPYASNFYSESFEKLAFYAEIYNSDKVLGEDESFLINYSINSYDTDEIIGNYRRAIRETSKPINALLQSFSIKDLSSGNYNLVIDVRNKNNEQLITKKIFFQRSNQNLTPILTSDDYNTSFVSTMEVEELEDYIKSIYPISSRIEINFANNQLKGQDKNFMQQYFYNFWLTRNAVDPKKEWENYYKKVIIVNEKFGTQLKKGYETDRGRVFLKHGKPNTLSERKNEPSAYPYEIWHYYKTENFSNIKFVFYDPDGGSTNDYRLLHSNLTGEINNPQWRIALHKRTNQARDLEQIQNSEHYGGRVDDYYDNPR